MPETVPHGLKQLLEIARRNIVFFCDLVKIEFRVAQPHFDRLENTLKQGRAYACCAAQFLCRCLAHQGCRNEFRQGDFDRTHLVVIHIGDRISH